MISALLESQGPPPTLVEMFRQAVAEMARQDEARAKLRETPADQASLDL
jgi:hypothetical protein